MEEEGEEKNRGMMRIVRWAKVVCNVGREFSEREVVIVRK